MNEAKYSVAIKELPVDDRPRERLEQFGPSSLGHAELIAILLGGGYQNISAITLAQQLLQDHGDIAGLATCELEELTNTKGIGLAKACSLMAAFELGKRVAAFRGVDRPSITSPEIAAAILLPKYSSMSKEHVGVLVLDTKNKVIKEVVVSIGTLDSSLVHPREVFKPAIVSNAASIILFHNHPSGDPTPSGKDIQITKRILEAGKLLSIELLDHLVIGKNGFTSLKSEKYF